MYTSVEWDSHSTYLTGNWCDGGDGEADETSNPSDSGPWLHVRATGTLLKIPNAWDPLPKILIQLVPDHAQSFLLHFSY